MQAVTRLVVAHDGKSIPNVFGGRIFLAVLFAVMYHTVALHSQNTG